MTTEKFSAVFFGSGPVALEGLRLLSEYADIEAIITKPATQVTMESAFPKLPVFAVQRRAELDALCSVQQFQSKLGILIDFGVIVDEITIKRFPLGIINSHFSLLPEWRGVDPITFSILSGQPVTGVSLMLLVPAWDEGPLLAQAPYNVAPTATTASLTHELVALSDSMLREVVPRYIAGEIQPAPQEEASLLKGATPTYSRKLTKEDGRIDWSKPAVVLEREVRAYIDWPHSYAQIASKDVIVTASRVADLTGKPGTIVTDKHHLYVHCGEQSLEILSLKPVGKPEMTASAFLAGYRKVLKI